jgi:D-glycerate 3-kinase
VKVDSTLPAFTERLAGAAAEDADGLVLEQILSARKRCAKPVVIGLKLAMRTLQRLLEADVADTVPMPTFDKSRDDRMPKSEWTPHRGSVAVILLEGWCVGARPQPEEDLATPVNELERTEDADGQWRRHVNRRLETG